MKEFQLRRNGSVYRPPCTPFKYLTHYDINTDFFAKGFVSRNRPSRKYRKDETTTTTTSLSSSHPHNLTSGKTLEEEFCHPSKLL